MELETKVTIKQIAESLGISRGTVDRALNNRGRINDSTKNMVLQKAKELGYKPNILARSLALKRTIHIAAVFPSKPEAFFDKIKEGMRGAQEEFKDFGIKIDFYNTETHNAIKQIEFLDMLSKEKIDGILLAPAHPLLLNPLINVLSSQDIPVVTFNSDAPTSSRLFFIGQNHTKAGKVAAGLMAKFVGARGKIAMLTGFSDVLALKQRYESFQEVIETTFPLIELIGPYEYFDDESSAYEITNRLLLDYPELQGIYITSGVGLKPAGIAIKDNGKGGIIKLIGFDTDKHIQKMLYEDVIDATICQDPYSQGYYSAKLLLRNILEGWVPQDKILFTRLNIVLKENANDDEEVSTPYRY